MRQPQAALARKPAIAAVVQLACGAFAHRALPVATDADEMRDVEHEPDRLRGDLPFRPVALYAPRGQAPTIADRDDLSLALQRRGRTIWPPQVRARPRRGHLGNGNTTAILGNGTN
jgi:hypothetical protein